MDRRELERGLLALAAEGRRFPSIRAFRQAGLRALYEYLRERGELDVWQPAQPAAPPRRWTKQTSSRLCATCQAGCGGFRQPRSLAKQALVVFTARCTRAASSTTRRGPLGNLGIVREQLAWNRAPRA